MSLPNRIGRHEIRGRIGAGGFATVWRGYDAELDDDVAVKVLAENWVNRSDIRDRFMEEARILRRADSDRVVRVHDIGSLPDGRPYFVMTYADGGTLADRLAGHPLPVLDALRLVEESARCVAELHDIGILHRDVKPSNILFRSTAAGRERVLIADLGVAKQLANASGLTSVTGSPGYMAPEQATFGESLDTRADVYSLGAVAYEILTGSLPTRGRSVPPSHLRPDVGAATDDVVMRALALDREQRFPDAAAFAAAVAAVSARSAAPPTRADPPNLAPLPTNQPPVQPPPAQPLWVPAAAVQRPAGGPAGSPPPVRPPAAGDPARNRPRTPRTVVVAAILTFVGAAAMMLSGAAFLLALSSVIGDGTEDVFFGVVPENAFYGGGAAVCFATGFAAIVLGIRSVWGRNGSRIALTVLAVAHIALDVLIVLRGVTWPAFVAGYTALVVVLYWVGGANAWFRRAR